MGPGQQPTDQRIGVIGAGASGLSAAHYLRRAGHGNVTVLERAQQVGGKCCSVSVGPHVYELGAVLATRNYDTTLELMESVGVEAVPTDGMHCFDADGHPIDLFPRSQIPRLLWQVLLHYAWATRVRYRRINEPGLVGIDPDLYEPFARFAGQHALPSLGEALALPFTGFGYGYFDEIPTAYVMKYLDLHMIESLISPRRRMVWPDGVQSLWARLAQELDVRTGVTIRSITRQGVGAGRDRPGARGSSTSSSSPAPWMRRWPSSTPRRRSDACSARSAPTTTGSCCAASTTCPSSPDTSRRTSSPSAVATS